MANFVNVEIGADPLRGGADLALAVTPMLIDAMRRAGYDTSEKRLHFWAGYISSMAGAVCADIGPGSTRAIFEHLQDNVIAGVENHIAAKQRAH